MTGIRAAHHGRSILALYAVWSAVIGAWGRTAPLFPTEARAGLGWSLAAACMFAAYWPTPARFRWAFSAVFAFSMWSAVRALVNTILDGTSIVAAATYATVGLSALSIAVLLAVFSGIATATDIEMGERA